MSNDKPPFVPDTDTERTVIKPNPGGKRDNPVPAAPNAPQQDIWGGQRQSPGIPSGSGAQRFEVPAHSPVPQDVAAGHITLNTSSDTGGPNPILEAAMPLLILLSNVRIARSLPQVAPLMGTVAQGIETFEATLHARNIPEAQVRSAKYALCATADDIVQNLPSTDRIIWTQYSMLSRFFQVRQRHRFLR